MITYHCTAGGTENGLSASTPTDRLTAQAMVQAVAGTDHIRVWVHGSRDEFAETMEFTSLDSGGDYTIIWQAWPGDSPSWSGGTPITGWTLHHAGNNIWKADVPAGSRFRRLRVNNQTANRARMDGSNFGEIYRDDVNLKAGYKQYDGPDVALIVDKSQLEFHFQPNAWNNGFIKATGGTTTHIGDTVLLFFDEDGDGDKGYDYWDLVPEAPTWLEGAYEFLAPGYFHLNRTTNVVYYVPRTGEDMSTAVVIAPMMEQLITVSDNCKNVYFIGIKREDTDWLGLNDKFFVHDAQNMDFVDWVKFDYTLDVLPTPFYAPAGTHVEYAENIRFIQCHETDHGGSGLAFQKGAVNCRAEGCETSRTGGNGIRNRDYHGYSIPDVYTEGNRFTEDAWRFLYTTEADKNVGTVIRSNKCHNNGEVWRGAVGITIGTAYNTKCWHNECYDSPYSGIDSRSNPGRLIYHFNNSIRKNKIHDVMLNTADGGGIYNQGGTYGLLVEENYIYNVIGATWRWPLYLDDYTMDATWQKNVIEKNPSGGPVEWCLSKNQRTTTGSNLPWYPNEPYPETNQLYPNKVIDNYYESGMALWIAWTSPTYDHYYNVYTGNTSFVKASAPAEVTRIKKESGVELLLTTDLIGDEVIIFGWLDSAEESVDLTASTGTIEDYEEFDNLGWRARVTGVVDGVWVSASAGNKISYITVGKPSVIIGENGFPFILRGANNAVFPFTIKM